MNGREMDWNQVSGGEIIASVGCPLDVCWFKAQLLDTDVQRPFYSVATVVLLSLS